MLKINIKRAYEAADPADGFRILVDRLWPRGMRKENLPYDFWAKELAPSAELRRFFHEDIMGHWQQFEEAYRLELQENVSLKNLMQKIKAENIRTITLVYGSRYTDNNHAIVLREVMMQLI